MDAAGLACDDDNASAEAAFAEAVAKVGARFRESLDERMAELEALLNLLDAHSEKGTVVQEVWVRVHKIAGVAGSVGFVRLGELAVSCEEAVIGFNKSPTDHFLDAIKDALDAVLNEIDRVLTD